MSIGLEVCDLGRLLLSLGLFFQIGQWTAPFFVAYFALIFLASRQLFTSTSLVNLTGFFLLNSFLAAGVYFAVCNVIFRLRRRRAYLICFHVFLSIFFLTNFLYLSYFGSLFSLFAVQQVTQLGVVLGQVSVFFGGWMLLSLLIALGTLIWQLRLLPRVESVSIGLKLAPLVILCLVAKHFYVGSMFTEDTFFENYSQSRTKTTSLYGFVTTYVGDALVLRQYRSREAVFPRKDVNNRRQQFNRFLRPDRYNIVSIQVESLDYGILFHRIHDEPVMPFLDGLAAESLLFSNFFAQHGAGGSSDSELSYFTGLLPVQLLGALSTSRFSDVETLPKILARFGYAVVALHPNSGTFYDRGRAYERLGFQEFIEAEDFEGPAKGWYAKDIDFFRQGIQKITKLPQPFFAHFITNQSHGPFENNDTEYPSTWTENATRMFTAYMETMREVDQAIETFFMLLSEAGLSESTIVVIFGDHAAVPQDPFQYEGGDVTLLERVPLIIHHPNLPGETILRAGSHLDLGPTLLSLIGNSESPEWLGESLLAEGPGTALIRRSQLYLVRDENDVLTITPADRLPDEDVRYYESFFDYSSARLY